MNLSSPVTLSEQRRGTWRSRLLLLGFLLFFSPHTYASDLTQTLGNATHFSLRIVPEKEEEGSSASIKNVEIRKSSEEIILRWYSQIRLLTRDEPWPEYKIMTQKGVLKTNDITASSMMHPHLWSPGFFALKENSLLWLQPETKTFEPGFLSPASSYFTKLSKDILEVVEQFKILANLLQSTNENAELKISNSERTKLNNFLQTFTQVEILTHKKQFVVVVNGKPEKVSTSVIGNKYVQYTVLANPQNPLVLQITFLAKDVPTLLAPYFSRFQDYFGYAVSQIQILN